MLLQTTVLLLSDEVHTRRLLSEKSNFGMIDGVLFYESSDNPGCSRITVPDCLKLTLLKESHNGKFLGHFSERKLYATLRTRYWWKRMHADIRCYHHGCLVLHLGKVLGEFIVRLYGQYSFPHGRRRCTAALYII